MADVAAAPGPIFPHCGPGPGAAPHSHQCHPHTRSRNNTRSKHIRMPPHHTRALPVLLLPLGWGGRFGLELGVLGGKQAEALSLLEWFSLLLLEVEEGLW